MGRILGVLATCVLVGCDGPDEWTCEIHVGGTAVCIDGDSRKICESDWGGTATASEKAPGGPFEYCADIGYAVECSGSLIENGEDFTAEHLYYAASEEDCTATDGAEIGG